MALFNHPLACNLPEVLDPGKPLPWSDHPAIPPPDLRINFLSVGASANLGMELDLGRIAKRGINLKYKKMAERPNGYSALLLRQNRPASSAMVFKSGKIVVTASKSERHAKVALYNFAKMIRKVGYKDVDPAGLEIKNIMAQTHVRFRVKLDKLYKSHDIPPKFMSIDPDMGHNRIDIDLVQPKATVIVFESGSVLFTGLHAEKDAREALKVVYPFLKKYAK